jgi:NDP-sugar pyrophosphorylase family protein
MMEGMILAAGAGTRLGSITEELPKAMVQVGGKPLLEWVVESMARAGVTRIIINTHHHEASIRAFVQPVAASCEPLPFFGRSVHSSSIT